MALRDHSSGHCSDGHGWKSHLVEATRRACRPRLRADDHDPSHIHVEYAGDEGDVGLAIGKLMRGVILHEDELEENWRLAKAMQPVQRVESLP